MPQGRKPTFWRCSAANGLDSAPPKKRCARPRRLRLTRRRAACTTSAMKSGLFLALVLSVVIVLSPGCKKPAASAPAGAPPIPKEQSAPEKKAALPLEAKAAASTSTNSSRQVLVFRNVRSWNRKTDFEEVLTDFAFQFDVKSSAEMGTDLTPYLFVIIPGAQWQDDFYRDYAENSALFERYVTNGGDRKSTRLNSSHGSI